MQNAGSQEEGSHEIIYLFDKTNLLLFFSVKSFNIFILSVFVSSAFIGFFKPTDFFEKLGRPLGNETFLGDGLTWINEHNVGE